MRSRKRPPMRRGPPKRWRPCRRLTSMPMATRTLPLGLALVRSSPTTAGRCWPARPGRSRRSRSSIPATDGAGHRLVSAGLTWIGQVRQASVPTAESWSSRAIAATGRGQFAATCSFLGGGSRVRSSGWPARESTASPTSTHCRLCESTTPSRAERRLQGYQYSGERRRRRDGHLPALPSASSCSDDCRSRLRSQRSQQGHREQGDAGGKLTGDGRRKRRPTQRRCCAQRSRARRASRRAFGINDEEPRRRALGPSSGDGSPVDHHGRGHQQVDAGSISSIAGDAAAGDTRHRNPVRAAVADERRGRWGGRASWTLLGSLGYKGSYIAARGDIVCGSAARYYSGGWTPTSQSSSGGFDAHPPACNVAVSWSPGRHQPCRSLDAHGNEETRGVYQTVYVGGGPRQPAVPATGMASPPYNYAGGIDFFNQIPDDTAVCSFRKPDPPGTSRTLPGTPGRRSARCQGDRGGGGDRHRPRSGAQLRVVPSGPNDDA